MINALGHNANDSFRAICDGKCGVSAITLFDCSDFSVKIAAEVKNFDPLSVVTAKEVKKIDRFIQLGLVAAKEAMSDAAFSEDIDRTNFGVVSAAGIGGLPNIERNSLVCAEKGPGRVSAFFIPSALVNMLGGVVSIEHSLKGPNLSCVTACAASSHAIIEAYKTLACGMASSMLVVGSESTICATGVSGFASMKALSTRNDTPQIASSPFDAKRDGFVMGEGAAALVLEPLDLAIKRGAKIYAEIAGLGASGDAYHITAPSTDGAMRSMRAALAMSKSRGFALPEYINAHGTSTPANDKNETAAMKAVFAEFGSSVPAVSSTKGQTGHCLGAAGAMEAVISLLAVKEGILPPTINLKDADPDCDLDYVPNEARRVSPNIVMSNSFGFGGTNASVIFSKYHG